MLSYVLRRLVISVLTLLVLVSAVFFLVRAMPGDPFFFFLLTPEIRENMRAYHGFDKPVYVQYFKYIGNLLHGDL